MKNRKENMKNLVTLLDSMESDEKFKTMVTGEFYKTNPPNINGFVSFFSAAVPTLGRLAEASGIIAEGNTLALVMRIVGWITVATDAATLAARSLQKTPAKEKTVTLRRDDMV